MPQMSPLNWLIFPTLATSLLIFNSSFMNLNISSNKFINKSFYNKKNKW